MNNIVNTFIITAVLLLVGFCVDLQVSALRRLAASQGSVGVKDLPGFVEAMHVFAIHHYLTVCFKAPACLHTDTSI